MSFSQIIDQLVRSAAFTLFLFAAASVEARKFYVIPDGFPIRVGPAAPTAARLSAVDPDDVANFLFCLFTARVSVSPPSETSSG